MKVLTIAATNSRNSINRRLLDHAADALRAEVDPGAEVSALDLNDHEMPIYSVDREAESGVPEAAQRFLDRIAAADVLLISYAEHNGHYSVAWKNVFDWASRLRKDVFQDKPMVLMAASPGPGGARNVLAAAVSAAPFHGGQVAGSFSVARFGEAFDAEAGRLKDQELSRALSEALGGLRLAEAA